MKENAGVSPSVCAQAHSQPPHQRGPRGRGYRKVAYAQSMAEKPTAAQARAAEERMRQHLIAECDKAGYPVRGFLDTTVRQVGRRGNSLSVCCTDSSPIRRSQGRWIITVTALIGHVV